MKQEKNIWEQSRVELFQKLDCRETGLSQEDAALRLLKYGANELHAGKQKSVWQIFLGQFADFLVLILILAAVISACMGDVESMIVILAVITMNAVLGTVQTVKASASLDSLKQMSAPTAKVLRDGQIVQIPGREVVPGDVVILEAGDSVCADGRLLECASLKCAESALTGESLPVEKDTEPLSGETALGDRKNMVFSGSFVTYGRGRFLVTATGMDTEMGKIAQLLKNTEERKTPLQVSLDQFGRKLSIIILVICAVLFGVSVLWRHENVMNAFLFAVALAVAAIPEALSSIITIVQAMGTQKMARQNAIIKDLKAVETLGSVSVICSDKTGTLTRNEMTVERVVTPSGEVQITGTGYAPEGRMVIVDQRTPERAAIEMEAVATLGVGALANDGDLREHTESGIWEAVGDPTEVSLIVGARKVKADRRYAHYGRVGEIPFTSERKRMSIVAQDNADAGRLTVFSKGAPDVLLGYCNRIAVDGAVRPLTEGDRQQILATVERLSSEAYRTLGQAYRPLGTASLADVPGVTINAAGHVADIAEQSDVLESELIWVGMVGIIDPPRTEVRASVSEAHRAGIRTVMITGDHPLTAARIATDLGIIEQGGKALTGDQLDALPGDDAFDKATAEVSVYAHVAPEHKLKIVKSLQRQGNIVAMTGDGVNDAPAVKTADIGVAMGITGTEVTKQSAKMILADDNFSPIVAAVREGRGIFDNIRKFLRYLLSSNVGEVFTVFGGVIFAGFLGITQPGTQGVTVPLLATQLLWINLLTDAAPALAMGVDPSTDDVMARKPRRLTDRVIDGEMWGDIIFIGVIMAAVTLIGMDMHLSGGLFTDRSVEAVGHEAQMIEARTMGFTILVFAQMFNALASRSHLQSVFVGLFANKWLWGAIGVSVALQLAVIYVPFLNTAFGTVPLSAGAWLECVGLALIVLIASELRKCVLRAMRR